MKKRYLLVVFLFLETIASAQITFQKTYGDTIYNSGNYFIQGNDSGFYLLFTSENSSFHYDWRILKTNKYGDSLSTASVPLSFTAGSEYCNNSKNQFVITTLFDSMVSSFQFLDTIYVTIVDTTGNIISQWKYADTLSFLAPHIFQTSDGGYLIGAGNWNYPNQSNILLMKIDSVGNLQWKENIFPYSISEEFVIDIAETSDHYFIVEVQQESGSNWAGSKVMLKVDSTGNVLWNTQLTYGYGGGSVHQIAVTDSGYIYVDNIGYSQSSQEASRISLVDTGGTIRWSKIFNSDVPYYSQIILNQQGRFYLCGSIGAYTHWDIIITELDQNADSMTSFIFGFSTTSDRANYFNQLSDGRLTCLGYSESGSTLFSSDIYFLVTDTMGNVTSGISESINHDNSFTLSPNPTTSLLTLRAGETKIESATMYNMLGEEIMSDANIAHDFNREAFSMDISSLPSGIYIVQANSKEKVWRGKVVKE